MNIWDFILSLLQCKSSIPPYHIEYARIDGANLFPYEYQNNTQFSTYKDLYDGNTNNIVARLPFPTAKTSWDSFSNTLSLTLKNNITPLILLQVCPPQLMSDSINWIKKNFPQSKNFEIFNEVWQMAPDTEVPGLDALINLTNDYCNIIKATFSGAFVLSGAPANSLQPIEYDQYGTDNAEMVETLIKNTKCDGAAIHLYAEGSSQERRFKDVNDNIQRWLNEAQQAQGYRKQLWITETGYDGFNGHVKYYNEWTSRYVEYMKANRIIWYRHTIDKMESQDSGFALEVRNTVNHSPLWDVLKGK